MKSRCYIVTCCFLCCLLVLSSTALGQVTDPCEIEDEAPSGVSPPIPPCADFVYTPQDPNVTETVTFDASPSYQPVAGEIDGYVWYLHGSGSDAHEETTTTSFEEPGEHVVSLTVLNRAGQRTSIEKTIEVSDVPMEAEFSYDPGTPMVNTEMIFEAEVFDPTDNIESYSWEFGDGATKSGATVSHVFSEYGEYDVRLTVSDGEGTNSVTQTLIVENVPPEPDVGFDRVPEEPTTQDRLVFDGSGSYNPDGGSIVEYSWEFGNEETATGETVEYSFENAGTHTVSLTVDDGEDTSTESVEITVGGRQPEAEFGYSPGSPSVDDTIVFNASETVDPDEVVEEYLWDFGDGGTAQGEVVEHSYNELGSYEVRLSVDGMESDETVEEITVGPGEESADGFGVLAAMVSVVFSAWIVRRRRQG